MKPSTRWPYRAGHHQPDHGWTVAAASSGCGSAWRGAATRSRNRAATSRRSRGYFIMSSSFADPTEQPGELLTTRVRNDSSASLEIEFDTGQAFSLLGVML